MSNESVSLTAAEIDSLAELAKSAITFAIESGRELDPDPVSYSKRLQQPQSCFVTVYKGEELRGCVGSLMSPHPLVRNVARSAYSAALLDSRFPALEPSELNELLGHISVLSSLSPIEFSSESDLLNQLQPGIDGLLLSCGGYQGTFLPVMWEQIPQPAEFLAHLKIKAGLSPRFWSDRIEVSRYRQVAGIEFEF